MSALGTVDGAAVELTDDAAVNAATGAVHGRIDILVNNAGITGGNATTWELQPEVWRRVVEVNLIAPYSPAAPCRRCCSAVTGASSTSPGGVGKEGNPNACTTAPRRWADRAHQSLAKG